MLAVIVSVVPLSSNAGRIDRRIFAAIERTSSVLRMPSAMTTNSSPPSRAATSAPRTARTRRGREAAQQLVAERVTVAVVDRLEAVDVEIEQRHRDSVVAGPLHRRVDRRLEAGAIRRPVSASAWTSCDSRWCSALWSVTSWWMKWKPAASLSSSNCGISFARKWTGRSPARLSSLEHLRLAARRALEERLVAAVRVVADQLEPPTGRRSATCRCRSGPRSAS